MKYSRKINTHDWTMGNYPMPEPDLQTTSNVIEELREFHHYGAASALESFVRSPGLGWIK